MVMPEVWFLINDNLPKTLLGKPRRSYSAGFVATFGWRILNMISGNDRFDAFVNLPPTNSF